MKNPPRATAGDADKETIRIVAPVPFRIVAFQRVAFGSKVGELSIETPIGIVDGDLFTPEGCEPFVQARSVRDKFTGRWRRTIALDSAFAACVLDALRGQASKAPERRAKRNQHDIEPSEMRLKSECGIGDAFAGINLGGAT